ncbi:helix-turn-helix domain-containing protein [Paenibacillus rigui]|uniref:Helix-turn-helix domain-containing protein n=1 Tax=Paenibacillus rigui TaxID=554312 RepID=A0A229UMS0_9BACL|nr:RodZ domain-containing protein [Paenibacillus rigui]OXM84738.1 helix-turn-helix domain-containing protein [Paenibacillus rigui]
MSELGQMLRKARLESKISLDDLQEMTKIRKRYLEAIEDGNFKVLPGNFYVRAFIKSYAEAVGLDPNEVLHMYQNVIPAPEQEQTEPIRTKRTSRNNEKIGKWASNIMMISFVVLILGIIYYYLNMNYSGAQRDVTANDEPKRVTDKVEPTTPSTNTYNNTVPVAENNQTAAVPTPPPAPKAEVKLVKSQGGTDFYSVSNASKLTIEMKVTGDACWFQIDSLGQSRDTLEQGTYTNGKSQKWELDNSAFMIFGRSNAVELMVNGTSVTVGDTPNAKRIQFDLQKNQG